MILADLRYNRCRLCIAFIVVCLFNAFQICGTHPFYAEALPADLTCDLTCDLRELQLLEAMNAPLFSDRPRAGPSAAERLPYVFDSYSQARQTSSFVAGNRISLPVGCEWSDHKLYQAVEIPVAEQAPTGVGDERVSINTLDQVGGERAVPGCPVLSVWSAPRVPSAGVGSRRWLLCLGPLR